MIDAREMCQRFLDACDRISCSWSLAEGLSGLGQLAHFLLRPHSVAVALLTGEDGLLKILASRGVSGAFLSHHTMAADQPGVQRVVLAGEDVRVAEIVPGDPLCEALRLETASGSLIATPIFAMSRPIGLMVATSEQAGYFDEDHLLVLKLIARMAASCHDRCALYEERRRWMAVEPDTGLWSFEFFCNRMGEEIARSRRQKAPLSLILVDIDGFLRYKQTHGSDAAHELFMRCIEITRSAVRGIDFMGRFGTDEVLVALPQTDLRGAVKAGQRICEAVEKTEPAKAGHGISVSIGVASLHGEDDQPGIIIDRARRALFSTVARGGNCVCAEAER